MKLYLCQDGTYAGTQADAKLRGKQFEQVEVPTDKEGLLSYLNQMVNAVEDLRPADEFTTVVERQDPPVEETEEPQTLNLSYLQTFFDQAPITLQLELAVRAIDAADKQLRPITGAVQFGGKRPVLGKAPEEIAADLDDEMFS
jgi:hypothetical protein